MATNFKADLVPGVLSVSLVKHRPPGSCWGINLDNCSGVSCQQKISLFRGIAYHWPAVYLVGFMFHKHFKLVDLVLHLCFSSMPTLKLGLYPIVCIIVYTHKTSFP